MKLSAEQIRFIKGLVSLSLENGKVSATRVEAVLEVLRSKPPRQLRALLKSYLRRIRREIARTTLQVESATEVSEETLSELQKWAEAESRREVEVVTRINTDLIAGFRLQIADTVIEKNIKNDLERLKQAI